MPVQCQVLIWGQLHARHIPSPPWIIFLIPCSEFFCLGVGRVVSISAPELVLCLPSINLEFMTSCQEVWVSSCFTTNWLYPPHSSSSILILPSSYSVHLSTCSFIQIFTYAPIIYLPTTPSSFISLSLYSGFYPTFQQDQKMPVFMSTALIASNLMPQ